ncbi:hypothetical protein DEIPH_ctg052orf0026 [Deinococcus phoenicis]|uniref:Uncharacterized protein n=1 Tax=Deinococcus phoenicis TaxID=1476583 RepID=A0A016QLQ0_9DEIO|nr:hypothetical protein DEIPH_ctg052orf0026 [Deinococcus phoenicis]
MVTFSNPLTRRITDYLRGHQLGPENPLAVLGADGKPLSTDFEGQVSYWTGDLLPSSDPRYGKQVQALRKSFVFRNVTLEGVEMLADGVGADEPDWGFTVSRPLGDDEKPTEDEEALIRELEGILTSWWDRRDLPGLLQTALVTAIAHGRQPVRPRIPDRFRDSEGRLKQQPPEKSLDGLWLTLPDVADSGIYTDPDTLEDYGLTRLSLPVPGGGTRDGWELTRLDEDGRTIVRSITPDGDGTDSGALDLGGQLWLLELRFARGAVTRDVLANQDALNVGLTSLSRNTRWAAFEKTILLGVDPPLDDDGRIKPLTGPGAESYLQPSVAREVETQTGPDGQQVEVSRERMYPGASVNKLDPAEPKAIQAAIDQATANIYSILRQRFMLMDDQATVSGRSREVATGSYLRAVARYGVTVEAFIRALLMLAARVSAIVQGRPGRYDGLRPVVTCRQRVFEPSADAITTYQALQQAGVISLQTLRGLAGIADPDAEQQQIDRERGTSPPQPKPQP